MLGLSNLESLRPEELSSELFGSVQVEALEAVFKTKKADLEKGLRKKKRRKNKGTGTVIIDSDKQEVWGVAG